MDYGRRETQRNHVLEGAAFFIEVQTVTEVMRQFSSWGKQLTSVSTLPRIWLSFS